MDFNYNRITKLSNVDNAILLDTNAILYILKNYDKIINIIEDIKLTLIIINSVFDETIEHHKNSIIKGNKNPWIIRVHLHNFSKILNKNNVYLYSIPKEKCDDFIRYDKDACLHYALVVLKIKHIVTIDPEITKIYKDRVIKPQDFF